jgi:hypothetical protein
MGRNMVLRPERKKNGFEEKNISIFVFLKNLDLSKVEISEYACTLSWYNLLVVVQTGDSSVFKTVMRRIKM